jgi:DNA-binding beta-propeller fold protein YncE
MHYPLPARMLLPLSLLLSLAPLQGEDLRHLFTIEGFSTPECVVVDPETGLSYVSNMATPPETYWADTGKGFISRLRPDGTLDLLRWVESTEAFVIHQPKGMAIHKGMLYVADNSRVLVLSLSDARPPMALEVSGAQQLNDMATDGKQVYVSDTGTGRILRLDLRGQGQHEVVGQIEGVNGITIQGETLFAVSWLLHDIFEVSLTGSHAPKAFGLAHHFTNLDGIERIPDGSFIVSDFTGNKIAAVSADRQRVKTLFQLTTPADIGIDRERGRLYVPQLQSDRVVVLSLAP